MQDLKREKLNNFKDNGDLSLKRSLNAAII